MELLCWRKKQENNVNERQNKQLNTLLPPIDQMQHSKFNMQYNHNQQCPNNTQH